MNIPVSTNRSTTQALNLHFHEPRVRAASELPFAIQLTPVEHLVRGHVVDTRRATLDTEAPGSNVSSTIARRSWIVRRRCFVRCTLTWGV
jgi:hypothetical protein